MDRKIINLLTIGLLILAVMIMSGCAKAEFEVSSLDVTPREPIAGESVTVDAKVSNLGAADGVYTANLILDTRVIESKDVKVTAESAKKITFECHVEAAGEHTLQLGKVTTQIVVLGPEELIKRLRSSDDDMREHALQGLVKMGTSSVETLLVAMQNDIKLVREKSKEALFQIFQQGDLNTFWWTLSNYHDAPDKKVPLGAILILGKAISIDPPFVTDTLWRQQRSLARDWGTLLGSAITGVGIVSAGNYDSGVEPHPLLILDPEGQIHPWTYELDLKYLPASIVDLELIVHILNDEPLIIEELEYGPTPLGPGIYEVVRQQTRLEIDLLNAATGETVSSRRFLGSLPRKCRSTEEFNWLQTR